MLCHPCILGAPQTKGDKKEVSTSSLPSYRPKRGRKGYATLAFSGIPDKAGQNKKWPPHHCLRTGPKIDGNATPVLHSWEFRNKKETKAELVASSLAPHTPKRGR